MNDDKKFTLIYIIILEIVFVGICIFGAVQEWGFGPTFIVAIIGAAVVTFIFLAIKNTGCPKCGKKLAMKEISRKTVSSYATTVDVDREVKNSKGEVIRRYKEAVPATRYIYDCVDECKYCGYSRDVRREATYRD